MIKVGMSRDLDAITADYDKAYLAMSKLIATAKEQGRDLTPEEHSKFDTLDAEIRVLANEKKEAEKNERLAPFFASLPSPGDPDFEAKLAAMRGGSGGPGVAWQTDSRGTRYAILAKGDNATSLLPERARNEFGHFVLAKLFGPSNSTPPSVRAALTGDLNHLGGFMVPEELFGGLIDLARAKSVLMRSGLRTILMNSDSLLIPTVASDVVVKLRGENDAIHESNNTFGAIRLVAKNAGVLTKMSRELAEDAPELLAEQIGQLLVSALVSTIDKWGLAGAGGLEPEGLYEQVTATTGSIGGIDWTDVSAAATAIRSVNHDPNAVILSPKRYADLFNAESGDGVNAQRGWLDVPPSLRGLQFLPTTNNPDTKAMIGDFTRYVMGLRTSPLVEATTTGGDAFGNHQIHVKITARFDFACLDKTAFHSLTGITD